MGRIVLGLMVLLQICVCAQEKPAENDLLQEQVRNLGAETFRDRATASEWLAARIQTIDDQIVENLENGSPKHQDGAPAKDAQQLMAEGRRFYKHIKSAKALTEDPEVRLRLNAVLKTARFSSAFFELGLPKQQLVIIPFETHIQGDGNAVSRKTYGREGFGITDLGNIRIVREGRPVSGVSTSSHIYIRQSSGSSSGSSGSGSRRFNYKSSGGLTAIEWGDTLQFSISNGVLIIDGRSIPFSDTSKFVFVSKHNKVTAVIKGGIGITQP